MPKSFGVESKEIAQATSEVSPVELNDADLENVVAGLSGTDGGLALIALSFVPGINLGIAAFALTTGVGFIVANAWYGGRGGSLPR
jgi:hypothetical protein